MRRRVGVKGWACNASVAAFGRRNQWKFCISDEVLAIEERDFLHYEAIR
jgi:hypothetical protein